MEKPETHTTLFDESSNRSAWLRIWRERYVEKDFSEDAALSGNADDFVAVKPSNRVGFAVTQSIVRMGVKPAGDKHDMAEVLSGRLLALASARALVLPVLAYNNDRQLNLASLLDAILQPHQSTCDGGDRVVMHGPPFECDPRAVSSIALVIHELATNAVKYGALQMDSGRVDLRWQCDGSGLVLSWRESGGPPVSSPTHVGFGTNLVKASVRQSMSPLSIAQYLPPDHALFDVVIFDEASQITTWDAIGAIARARQTIIVGDPKQLPPTNFFGRNEDDEEVAEHERDLESILDEAKAAGIPVRALRWHYRSRNESLIAFSNHHYYQNGLITFPSSNVDDRAVQLRHVPDGVYDRGKSRTNRIEAFAVAAEAKRRMLHWLDLPKENRPTLGVITFNAQQQSLIQDLLDDARRDNPDLEWFFADERVEPTIVKNLENVQGDERDVILFSITFTQDAAGKRSMDFGALNRDGGERRLNVALTRARQELLVFSGFTADQIDASRTKAIGVNHLKTFLDFAARGPIALPAQDQGSKGPPESPFEEAVAAELGRLGWHITPQVGISGFRVDIGIKHPERAGAYLAGVECDGATYHRSATARDCDKVREQVLRGLGWNIIRVWSTDWWFDPKGAAERLHNALSALLEDWRHTSADQPTSDETTHWDMGHEVEPSNQPEAEVESSDEAEHAPRQSREEVEERVGGPDETISQAPAADAPIGVLREAQSGASSIAAAALSEESSNRARYKIADLSIVRAVPDRFHDLDYESTLRAMVEAVVDCEAPLREDILAQHIARAHGWLRTGSKIRERVMLHLKDADRTSESSGDFIWRKGTVAALIDYRPPCDADSRRAVSEISLAELASAVVANEDILEDPDPALALARLLGVERLATTARARLDEALARARNHLSKPARHIEGG